MTKISIAVCAIIAIGTSSVGPLSVNSQQQSPDIKKVYYHYVARSISRALNQELLKKFANRQWTGIVVFRLERDGKVSDVHTKLKGGTEQLDADLIEAVKRAVPYHSIPNKLGAKELNLEYKFGPNLSGTVQDAE